MNMTERYAMKAGVEGLACVLKRGGGKEYIHIYKEIDRKNLWIPVSIIQREPPFMQG